MLSSIYREMAEKRLEKETQKLNVLNEQLSQSLSVTESKTESKFQNELKDRIYHQGILVQAVKNVLHEFITKENKSHEMGISNPNYNLQIFSIMGPQLPPNVGEKGSIPLIKKERERAKKSDEEITQLSISVRRNIK